jgi:hypothetical protein
MNKIMEKVNNMEPEANNFNKAASIIQKELERK